MAILYVYDAEGNQIPIPAIKGKDADTNIYYSVVDGGIYVNSRYSADNDICFYLCKKGPNSIFDFSTIGLVAAADPVSNVIAPSKYIVSAI